MSAGIFVGDGNGWAHFYTPSGKMEWEVKLGGVLRAAAVATKQDLLFVCSTDGKGFCLNPNGSVRWSKDLGDHMNQSAVCVGGSLLIGDLAGNLLAFETDRGKKLWSINESARGGVQEPAVQVSETLIAFIVGGEIVLLELPKNEATKDNQRVRP
jgi:outer membrane protein assembly factor BamB